MKMRSVILILAFGLAGAMSLPRAHASSNFAAGRFDETDPAGPSYRDPGVCQLFAGPRGDLSAGRFLLTLGDHNSAGYTELQVTGKFDTELFELSGGQDLRLVPDRSLAVEFFETTLQGQLGESDSQFALHSLTANVTPKRLPGHVDLFDCDISLAGRLTGGTIGTHPVSLTFHGPGQYFPPVSTPEQPPKPKKAALATAADPDPSCPTSSLAPAGLAPLNGAQCTTPNCLINFKGYQWWTSYDYFGPPFPQKSYFWNANNQWSPKNAIVDGAGLHFADPDPGYWRRPETLCGGSRGDVQRGRVRSQSRLWRLFGRGSGEIGGVMGSARSACSLWRLYL
jgi:hypothetical protein